MKIKDTLIDALLITVIAGIYLYSLIFTLYVFIGITDYELPYEINNVLSHLYYWASTDSLTALLLFILGFAIIGVTLMLIVEKSVIYVISLFKRLIDKIYQTLDDIIEEEF